jgi:hypothetical protein
MLSSDSGPDTEGDQRILKWLLRFATSTLGADFDHFVNEGIVQFGYRDSPDHPPK